MFHVDIHRMLQYFNTMMFLIKCCATRPSCNTSHDLHAQVCKMTSSEKMQKRQGGKVVKIRIEHVKTPRLSHMKNESFNANGMRREGTGTSIKSKEIKF